MTVAVVLAVVVAVALLMVLARYATVPAARRAEFEAAPSRASGKREVDPIRFRVIVAELLIALGMSVERVEPLGSSGTTRLVAMQKGASRAVIYLVPRPGGHVVKPSALLA